MHNARSRLPKSFTTQILLLSVLTVPLVGCSQELVQSEPREGDAQYALATPIEDDSCLAPDGTGGTLLNVGSPFAEVKGLAQSATRIVSRDGLRSWTLWERATGRPIVAGGSPDFIMEVELAGDVLLTQLLKTLELRSAQDGSLRAAIPLSNALAVGLSPDGRYAFASDDAGLRVWDASSGALRATHPGPMYSTRIRASADVLRVAGSYSSRVQTLTFATGELRSSATEYQGNFGGWLLDGNHFWTLVSGPSGNSDATMRLYDADAKLIRTLKTFDEARFGGDREHYYASNGRVTEVYRIDTGAPVLKFEGAPAATSGRSAMAAFIAPKATLRLLDLRGSTPVLRDHSYGGASPQLSLVDEEGRWIFANEAVIYDGTRTEVDGRPKAFGCGKLSSMVGSQTKLAIATTDRTIRIFSLRSGSPQLTAKIEGVQASQLELSVDGRFLFLKGLKDLDSTSTALHGYELDQDGKPLRALSFPRIPTSKLNSISISALGMRLAYTDCPGPNGNSRCWTRIFDDGTQVFQTPIYDAPLVPRRGVLSPSGSRFATGGVTPLPHRALAPMYEDLTLKTTLDGVTPLLWIDEERLLVSRQSPNRVDIVDRTGQVLSTLAKPLVGQARSAGLGRFHDNESVYANDGKVLWSLRREGERRGAVQAALVGDNFVYLEGSALRVEILPPAAP